MNEDFPEEDAHDTENPLTRVHRGDDIAVTGAVVVVLLSIALATWSLTYWIITKM